MVQDKVSIIKNFSPAWFAAIMGTGGLASVILLWGEYWPGADKIGLFLAYLNMAFFVVLFIPWFIRWFTYGEEVKKDLNHPLLRNFFMAFPIAVMVIALNINLMAGKGYFSNAFAFNSLLIAWLVGAIGAIIFGVWATFIMMREENTPPQMINFSWFIPPVGSVLVPLVGNPLAIILYKQGSIWAQDVLLINITFLGIGILLFFFIGAFIFSRMVQHPLPPAAMAPSFWILLGPIGAGAVALISTAETAVMFGIIQNTGTVCILGIVLWGLGFWALLQNIALMWHYLKQGPIPFSLSWWAFVFPVAIYTMATIRISHYIDSVLLYYYAILLTLLLIFFWIISFIGTVKGVINKSIFAGHAPHPPKN